MSINIFEAYKISREKLMTKVESPFMTTSQKAAVKVIKNYFWAKQIEEKGEINGRFQPLIVGPSGVGKSHAVAAAAKELNIPLFHMGLSDWIVRGSGTRPFSADALLEFVQCNHAGIIFLDEVDKLRSSSVQSQGWWQSVACEVFAFLDGKGALTSLGWNKDATDSLRYYLVVGAGSWQEALSNDQKAMGFGMHQTSSIKSRVEKAGQIPFEILARFSPKLIEIQQPTLGDYIKGFSLILRKYGFTKCSLEKMKEMAEKAIEQGRGARGLEYMATMLALWKAQKKYPQGFPAFESVNGNQSKVVSKSYDFNEKLGDLYQKCDVVAKLSTEFAAILRRFPFLNNAELEHGKAMDELLDLLADNLIYFARSTDKELRRPVEESITDSLVNVLSKIRQDRVKYLDTDLAAKAASFYAEASIWQADHKRLIGMC